MGLPALSGDVTSSQDTEDMGVATLPKNGTGPASKSDPPSAFANQSVNTPNKRCSLDAARNLKFVDVVHTREESTPRLRLISRQYLLFLSQFVDSYRPRCS